MTLAACAFAFAGVSNRLTVAWPSVPIFPKRTVTVLPVMSTSQNLLELESLNS